MKGFPVATICTEEFFLLAKAVAKSLRMPGLPIVQIPHPMAGQRTERVNEVAQMAFDEIIHVLTSDAKKLEEEYKKLNEVPEHAFRVRSIFKSDLYEEQPPPRIKGPDSIDGFNRLLYSRGLTDGLPVIPPTEERVGAMISTCWEHETILGLVPPMLGEASIEKIAINAVMAGCLPEHFPVVVAATKAMLEESFNLYALQTTTHLCTVLIIVNGPVVDELQINCGPGAMGVGFLSNATIGRAIRLILMNIGGAFPGVLDRATFGQPAKYSFCFAENEEESPWEALNIERGYEKSISTVTVVGAEGPHNVNDHGSKSAEGILGTISGVISTPGGNNLYMGGEPLIVLGLEHAEMVARDGFSKLDVKQYLFDHARVPLSCISEGNLERFKRINPRRFEGLEMGDSVSLVDDIDDYLVVVSGGMGRHSVVIPTFGSTKSITVPIVAQ